MRSALEAAGHCVRITTSGSEALDLARRDPPALMIIDMLLPDLSGFSLCRAIRETALLQRTPIVMFSTSDAEMDRVVAFEIGVDDFVRCPPSLRELTLRVDAILRRAGRARPDESAGLLRASPLLVDPDRREARVGDSDARLTAREFDVLLVIMRRPGRVVGRKTILEEVWGTATGKTLRVVDTHMKWIRRKIGPAGRYIETVRGVGYRFSDRVDSPPSTEGPADGCEHPAHAERFEAADASNDAPHAKRSTGKPQ
jgi:two-component system phosphate regulon response regulator PhoB